MGQTGHVDRETRESGLNKTGDDGRPERVRAAQAVDEVERQAGPACWLPGVEDLLAVDIAERHLGLLVWQGRTGLDGLDRIGTATQDDDGSDRSRRIIWRRLTGHTVALVTDQQTIDNQGHQDQDPRSQASGAREIAHIPQLGAVAFVIGYMHWRSLVLARHRSAQGP